MRIEKNLKYKESSIFYRVYGHGRPVMLVHGFGETGDVWKEQVKYLETKFRLIVPDLPGSGRSEMIPDMSVEGMAETLKEILDNESPLQTSPQGGGLAASKDQLIEKSVLKEGAKISESSQVSPLGGDLEGARASLIGHSMGGYITLAFVEKYGESLSSFGLFHSSAYADSEEKKTVRRKGIAFIKEHGAFEFLKTSTPNLFSPRFKEEFPEIVKEFIQSLNNFLPESLVSYYESMIKRPDRTAVLKKTQMPVLFIMGEFDNAVPMQDSLEQSHLPERTYINILHRSGHMGMMEESDKSNRLLEEFLRES